MFYISFSPGREKKLIGQCIVWKAGDLENPLSPDVFWSRFWFPISVQCDDFTTVLIIPVTAIGADLIRKELPALNRECQFAKLSKSTFLKSCIVQHILCCCLKRGYFDFDFWQSPSLENVFSLIWTLTELPGYPYLSCWVVERIGKSACCQNVELQ